MDDDIASKRLWAIGRVYYWWYKCHHKLDYPIPKDSPIVTFGHNMYRTAGLAKYNINTIKLSEHFLRTVLPCVFDAHTIAHEVVHIVADRYWKCRDHGRPWQDLMNKLDLPTNVYHHYPVSPIIIYRCPCGSRRRVVVKQEKLHLQCNGCTKIVQVTLSKE